MNSEHLLEWQFGGWHGPSPSLCWTLLLLTALVILVLTAFFYRHTLRALTRSQRIVFVLLRSGLFLLLLLCLAGPSRVERTYNTDPGARPLAVVVEHSPSMTTPDSRGTTRLTSAVHAWKKIEADALHFFPALSYFYFSSTLVPVPNLEKAVTSSDSGAETHLYESLDRVLKSAPPGGYGGIVCLTDGLDTTSATSEGLSARALQNHSPLYFVIGQNLQAPHDTLLVREMSIPGQVLRKSQFNATVVIEAHSIHERDVPVSLSAENQPVAQTNLHLHSGTNLIPWTVPVNSGEPGLIHLNCHLGENTEQESTSATVRVIGQNQVQVLFYQGTLDWGFRFIDGALRNDPSFTLTSLFDPSLNLTHQIVSPQGPNLTQLPDTAEGFQPFQIVVLSNVFADQLSATQQKALIDYVHGGGGLLFLVSDTDMAKSFSGTALESMLPVIFESPSQQQDSDETMRQFQDAMLSAGNYRPTYGDETNFVNNHTELPQHLSLTKFAFPAKLQRSQITDLFGAAGSASPNIPKFSTYAHVYGIKAGGEVLAIHPEDKTGTDKPRALLVSQHFGTGEVTTLLTDTLWRWRLSLPSESHDPEIFWQQLFRLLSRHETETGGMHFSIQPFFASLGQTARFCLNGATGTQGPAITLVSPQGQSQTLTAQPDSQAGSWTFQFVPNVPGTWHVRAEDSRGSQMETLLRTSTALHSDELSGAPPDIEGLRKLAESTGGSLLNEGTPDNWSTSKTTDTPELANKRSRPLWNNWAVLLMGLGFYVTELIWRRRAKLL